MSGQIPQWMVTHGRGLSRRQAVFESEQSAVIHAIGEAASEEGAILTLPDGSTYLIFKLRRGVEVVAQRSLTFGVS